MERGKRRLVTHTNPFITKLTKNGIKTDKSERRKSKTIGASLSLLATSVLNFSKYLISFHARNRTFAPFRKSPRLVLELSRTVQN